MLCLFNTLKGRFWIRKLINITGVIAREKII